MASVLVVDDEPGLAALLRDILEMEGYPTRLAIHGLSALQEVEQELPSLVVLDLMLPVLDAWSFLYARQQDPALAQVPVIVLTAMHIAATTLEGLEVTHCLGKPYHVDEIVRLAEQHVRAGM